MTEKDKFVLVLEELIKPLNGLINTLKEKCELLSNKTTIINENSTDEQYPSARAVHNELVKKQDTLVIGKNIKSLNGESLLGEGDIFLDGNIPTLGAVTRFEKGNFINGTFSAGTGVTASDYWIITPNSLKVNVGDRIVIKPSDGARVWWRIFNTDDLTVAANLKNGGSVSEETEYVSEFEGYFNVQVAKTDGTTIKPDDYQCSIIIDASRINSVIKTVKDLDTNKQDLLKSGVNVKTINGESILGEGDINVKDNSETPNSSNGLFSKYPPFTKIIDDCQDVSKWTITNTSGELSSVDTSSYVLGVQSLRSDSEMRSVANKYDLTKNNLVIKLKINTIGFGSRLLLSIGNVSTPNVRVVYELARGNDWTTPEGWQEVIISSNNYTSGSVDAIDFGNIDDLYFITQNLSGTGTVEVDWNLQYVGTRPKTRNKGIVTFTFDDGWDSQYTGVKVLAEKGITSTIFCIKEAVGTDNSLTLDEIKELVNVYGTDIEVHGDPSYDQWSEEDLKNHWSESQKYLKENGLGDGKHLAYPNGIFPENVVELAKDYFNSCRTIVPFLPVETLPVADRFRIRAVSSVGASGVTTDTVKQYIDRVKEDGGWLILVFHKIGDVTGNTMYCSEEDLNTIADYAIDSGVNIMNYAETMDSFYAQNNNRNTNDGTNDKQNNKVFEEIATVTVVADEDGSLPSAISISADDNGNPFELTDIYCEVLMGLTDGNSGKFNIKAGDKYILGNYNPYFTNTLRKWFFRYDSYGEGLGGLCVAPGTSLASTNIFPNSNVNGLNGQSIPVGQTIIIDSLTITVTAPTTGAKTFVEGTTITLWGVRKK